ncbi:MAG: hypothetical protein QOC92_2807 [Acidimicrobiaceae bacterium]|jgi:hypothetical protein
MVDEHGVDERPDTDTTVGPDHVDLRAVRRGHRLRLLFFIGVVAFLVAAAFGIFGYRSRTVSRTDRGLTTSVTYGQFTRRGVATPLQIDIQSDTDFSDDVTVAIDSSWLEKMDIHSISPQPDQESTVGDTVVWTFQKPKSNELQVSIDADAGSSTQPGPTDGSVAIAVGDQLIHQLTFRTWIWP